MRLIQGIKQNVDWFSTTFLLYSFMCLIQVPHRGFYSLSSALHLPTQPPPTSSSPASYFISNLMDTSFAQKVPWCLSGRQRWFCSLQFPACPGPSEPRGLCPPVMTRCSLALEVCANREQVGNLGQWALHTPEREWDRVRHGREVVVACGEGVVCVWGGVVKSTSKNNLGDRMKLWEITHCI